MCGPIAIGTSRALRPRVDAAAEAHLERQRALLAALSDAEQATLAALLRRLLAAIERGADG